ncbi:two-component system response regulator [Scytonema hofmannii PCC 7110]|uniref:Two-component system response regulator n=1 Tax=Scytonema hofmannii PCC 7110 TaxID=128403 RepID=A0A139XAX1_9CYAN|nr:response regulator [Scytonema hofmannii]KYC41848.1 two-component system response regulator [Scytonema hofmannii PCC 7110]
MTTKTILVIDDEEGVRELVQVCLETIGGWDVFTAPRGKEGLAIAETKQPDAILLDVMMPDMDGPTTLKKLQANELTNHIPTIFLTAKAMISEQQQFRNLGVAGIITKPFDALDLIERIREILLWE